MKNPFAALRRWFGKPTDEARILAWLHGRDWQYGTDIVEGAEVSRSTIFLHLRRLTGEGFLEYRDLTSAQRPGIPRRQWRLPSRPLGTSR